jgi:hypothetical protein
MLTFRDFWMPSNLQNCPWAVVLRQNYQSSLGAPAKREGSSNPSKVDAAQSQEMKKSLEWPAARLSRYENGVTPSTTENGCPGISHHPSNVDACVRSMSPWAQPSTSESDMRSNSQRSLHPDKYCVTLALISACQEVFRRKIKWTKMDSSS